MLNVIKKISIQTLSMMIGNKDLPLQSKIAYLSHIMIKTALKN